MNEKYNYNLRYCIAQTRDDLEQAFSLVYRKYLEKGYIAQGQEHGLRFTLFNTLPSTSTFVVKKKEKVAITATFILDSSLGLPMDELYKEELDGLRRSNRRIAEISQLALDNDVFCEKGKRLPQFAKITFVLKLFKLIFDYGSHYDKVDDFCIAIHPKHERLYGYIGFEDLGGKRLYPSVNNAPAVAKRLDLQRVREKTDCRKGLIEMFFSQVTDPDVFKRKFCMTSEDLDYFFVRKTDIFR
jgi:N-acyl amino acid synthase FeeM